MSLTGAEFSRIVTSLRMVKLLCMIGPSFGDHIDAWIPSELECCPGRIAVDQPRELGLRLDQVTLPGGFVVPRLMPIEGATCGGRFGG